MGRVTLLDKIKRYSIFRDRYPVELSLYKEQGYNNTCYLLRVEADRYIVRLLISSDIDRVQEYEIQMLAYEQDIGARPILLDEDNALMISEYIDGTHKNKLNKSELQELANTLKKLHNIKVAIPICKLLDSIEIDSKRLEYAIKYIRKLKPDYVLCHHDLNPQNILFDNNSIKFIDWEYAGKNDRYFDIASVIVEFDLDVEEESLFLRSYFGAVGIVDKDKLVAYKVLYRAVCSQWWSNRANIK